MVNPITEQDRYSYYTNQANTSAAATAAQKTAEAATQTVQASATASGGAQTARQDTVELSAKAQQMLAQSKATATAQTAAPAAGSAPAAATAESAEDPTLAALAQRVKAQANTSAQSVSAQTVSSTEEEDDEDTDLSSLTEQQISQLVSKGTVSSSEAAAELAKRAAGKTQTVQGDGASQLQASQTAAQTGLVLNAVA